MHDACPGVEAKPVGQLVQESLKTAPTAKLAVPAAQGTHALSVWPGAALKVPCGHCAHVSRLVAPATLLPVPAGHSEHRALPLVDEYEPGEQATQASALVIPLSALKVPAGHAV